MKLLVSGLIIAFAACLWINNADAMCIIDTDWPDKPCIDTSPPLPLSKSEWKELWSEYYTFKGDDWMQKQKSELDEQVKSGKLKEWIEKGYQTQNFANYNVWFYYYINDQAPAPEGYELEYTIDESIPSPLKQFKEGIPMEQIQCKKGLQLVQRTNDSSPACVNPQSIDALTQRGWIMQDKEIAIDLKSGQREGSLLVKEVFSDHVTGLNFIEYPVARDEGFPITLQIGESASNGCTVELTLLKIKDDTATFLKKEDNSRPCPKCLSEDTLIDTPNGQINVRDLKKGMSIFTEDEFGNKDVGVVLETGKTLVPQNHLMTHIILEDNRELFVSPNHPSAKDIPLGKLQSGDILDGTSIKFVETISYTGKYTYDILPSGPTGNYWANEILIKSTLK